jgi:hypothetical protein
MLIYDLADPQELQGFVRSVQEEQDRNQFILSQFLPNDNIDDIEYKVTKGGLQDEDAAFVRAWDTESPIGNRQGLERMFGELPPISKKIRLGEEERLRRRALERGNNQAIIEAIFADAAKMARAVVIRVELFRAEALFNASISIDENGVDQDIPFHRSALHDVVPQGALFSNTGASVPIQEEQAWVAQYEDTNGFTPALALVSTAIVNNLLLNTQYRSMAAQNGITPAFLNLNGLNQIRATYDLPPLVKYNAKVRVSGVQRRVTPNNEMLYLPPASEPLGRTLFGTTAEALELAGAQQISTDQAPGLVSVVSKTFDPVATWTKACAISLPVIVNPDFTLRATVQAA